MVLRRLAPTVLAALAAVPVLAGCAPETTEPGPLPAVGAMVEAPPCRAATDQIRAQADSLVRSGLREAGFGTVFVDCPDGRRQRYADDRQLTADLADRGVRVAFPDAEQRAATIRVGDGSTAELRTAVTRRVMLAQPLIAEGALDRQPSSNLNVLGNREVIGFVRDRRDAPGARVLDDPETYSRAVGETGLLLSLTNTGRADREMSVRVADLGLAGDDLVPARDVWTGRRIKAADGALRIRVPAGDTALLRIG